MQVASWREAATGFWKRWMPAIVWAPLGVWIVGVWGLAIFGAITLWRGL